MKILILLVYLILPTQSFANAAHPHIESFTSDGCSAAPDGFWRDCCFTHDLSYWMGGTEEEKLKADEGLRACINQKANVVGSAYYLGVRAGGSPNFPTPWRWGYGWPEGRGYKRLNLFEKETVARELDSICMVGMSEGLIIRFMKQKKIPMNFSRFLENDVTRKVKKKPGEAAIRYLPNPFFED